MKMLKDQMLLLVRLSMLTSQLVMDITLLHQEMLLDPPKLFLFYLSPTNQILVMVRTHTGNILKIILNNKYLITFMFLVTKLAMVFRYQNMANLSQVAQKEFNLSMDLSATQEKTENSLQ